MTNPTTPAGATSASEKTLGQIAYEEFAELLPWPWERLYDHEQEPWNRAAAAPSVRAEEGGETQPTALYFTVAQTIVDTILPGREADFIASVPSIRAVAEAAVAAVRRGAPAPLASAGDVGWKLVPARATPEMIHVMRYGADDAKLIAIGQEPEAGETPWPRFGEPLAQETYQAALATAPAAPEPAAGGERTKIEEARWALLRAWEAAPELPLEIEAALTKFENATDFLERPTRPEAAPSPTLAEGA